MIKGSDPRVRTSAGRWNAPRSSSERTTLRGEMREPEASAVVRPRSRGAIRPVQQNAREDPPLVAVLARRMRCAVRIRGGASPAQTTGEPSARVGPVPQHGLFGGTRCAARQPVPSLSASNGADEGEGGERVVTPSSQNEETVLFASVPVHRRIAEVGRTPSGSEKRATSDGRVESLVATKERVNGSLTIGGRSGAQAQERTGGKRGADHRELGDPHHVSAASSVKAAWFRSCFGAGEMRASVCRRKAPWIGEAHAFHEAPAEPVLAASEPLPDARRKASSRGGNRRRRQGCQRRSVCSMSRGGRKRRPVSIVRSPKWEARREARFSPASFSSGGPELPDGGSHVFGRVAQRAKETFARTSTEPRGSGTRVALERRRKVSQGSHRAGKRRRTSARVGTVSECRSRSDASPVATPAGATKRTSDTRGLAGKNRTQGV